MNMSWFDHKDIHCIRIHSGQCLIKQKLYFRIISFKMRVNWVKLLIYFSLPFKILEFKFAFSSRRYITVLRSDEIKLCFMICYYVMKYCILSIRFL